jgi:hypothetical protein
MSDKHSRQSGPSPNDELSRDDAKKLTKALGRAAAMLENFNRQQAEEPNKQIIQAADLAKVHAEINQYISFRFNILLAILTVFGFFLAGAVTVASEDWHASEFRLWDFLKHPDDARVWSVSWIAGAANLLYVVLYFVAQLLLGDMWMLSAYLLAAKVSDWESDSRELLKERPVTFYWTFGITRQLTIVTLLVATITSLAPFALMEEPLKWPSWE